MCTPHTSLGRGRTVRDEADQLQLVLLVRQDLGVHPMCALEVDPKELQPEYM